MGLDIVYLVVGLLVGAGAIWLAFRNKGGDNTEQTTKLNTLEAENREIRDRASKFEEQSKQLTGQLEATKADYQSQLEEVKEELRSKQQAVTDLNAALSAKGTEIDNLSKRLSEQKEEVQQLQEQFTVHFKNIANDILEHNSKRFTEQNNTNIGALLDPLQKKIKEFEEKVDQSHKASLMQNASLKEQLTQLQGLNQQMSDEAKALTRALKGESKTQGNWGEVILERILEKSGLVKDREYTVQQSYTAEDGRRYQPDVVINLPEGKTVVVDSKVSLLDYERYSSAEDDAEKEAHLKNHIRSIRAHIKGLSEKQYHSLYELSGLDFVLLFVPIEPAFSIAVQHDNDLYTEALDRNIVLVSTSTLLATLKTIASIWRQEYQNKNALEIARQSGALYDKFVGFSEDLIDIGRKIDNSKAAYKGAMNKLVEGRGNLIGRVQKLQELGAKTSKTISQPLLDKAGVEPGTPLELPEDPDQ